MKKLVAALALLLCLTSAAHATSITGNLTNLGLDVANTSLAVTFELKNEGYLGIPRVPSVPSAIARPLTTIIPDISGNLSGTVYGNDLIEVGGVLGSTYYRVCINSDGARYRCDDYLLADATPFNLALALPLNVPPVPVPPTADSTYLRLDLGNVAALDGNAGNFPCNVVTGSCPAHSIIYSDGSKLQGGTGFTYDAAGRVVITGSVPGNVPPSSQTDFVQLALTNTDGTSKKSCVRLNVGTRGTDPGWQVCHDIGEAGRDAFSLWSQAADRVHLLVDTTTFNVGTSVTNSTPNQFTIDLANGYITRYANATPGSALYLRGNGTQAVFAALAAADLTGTVANARLTGSGALTVATTSPITGGASVALGGTVTVACPTCVTSAGGLLLFSATPTTSSPTTTSSTPAILAELTSGAITTSGKVLLSFVTEVNETNVNDSVTFMFYRDGSPIGSSFFAVSPIGSQNTSASMTYADSTTAGSHTYNVRWNVNATNTATSPNTNRSFSVVSLN